MMLRQHDSVRLKSARQGWPADSLGTVVELLPDSMVMVELGVATGTPALVDLRADDVYSLSVI